MPRKRRRCGRIAVSLLLLLLLPLLPLPLLPSKRIAATRGETEEKLKAGRGVTSAFARIVRQRATSERLFTARSRSFKLLDRNGIIGTCLGFPQGCDEIRDYRSMHFKCTRLAAR